MRIGFIPARGGSKGLPGKNIKNFLGEPLVARTIRIAKESNCFDRIIVNTDDNEIAEVAENAGAEILLRPEEMGSDTAEVDPLIIWSLDRLNATQEKNLISLLYCTAPLRNSDDILKTVELVSNGIVDSALTLVETSDYLWKESADGFLPTNYEPKNRAARQEEKWNQFKENKAVYTFWAHDLIDSKCRINGRVGAHLMPATRSIDIDSLEDFIIAEAIAQSLKF